MVYKITRRVYFDKVTYKSSHGDYTAMQYLCSENAIKAVIDFASAKSLPAVWEIMRSYMQSASDTNNPIGRSGYGYKEYMLNTENKEKLLKFALWRTDVCRMLVDKADKISNSLISLAA